MKNVISLLFLSVMLTMTWAAIAKKPISQSIHNLSVSGPGKIKAVLEDDICRFCHTSHSAAALQPLWNKNKPGKVYQPYSSSTAKALPGQPTGSSLLCLSCHDGTIALGKTKNKAPINMTGGTTTLPPGSTRLGTDLRDDHPISFLYPDDPELVPSPSLNGPVKLEEGQVQCRSCHDPHDNEYGKFLVQSNKDGALCTSCHIKNFWNQSSHSNSISTWNSIGLDPWPNSNWVTVASNACQNCHRPHTAGKPERLLNYALEEDTCLVCHNGHVAQKDVQAEFHKYSRHPVTATSDIHDPAEPAVIDKRHVECADCHNPHATQSAATSVMGPLTGVRGVNSAGVEVNPANNEYEICFRCHADSFYKPAAKTFRTHDQTNVRMEFDLANPSYHPVVGPGKNQEVASLIPPLTTSSLIKCTDCHNNSSGPNAGGMGPNGPHGSSYSPLLERQYVTTDPNPYSSASYALCFKCHSESYVMNDIRFPHNTHSRDNNTACNVCHDPHGVSATQGNIVNNSALINFDANVVSPNSNGRLFYESLGASAGSCYLSCHDKDHDPLSYPK